MNGVNIAIALSYTVFLSSIFMTAVCWCGSLNSVLTEVNFQIYLSLKGRCRSNKKGQRQKDRRNYINRVIIYRPEQHCQGQPQHAALSQSTKYKIITIINIPRASTRNTVTTVYHPLTWMKEEHGHGNPWVPLYVDSYRGEPEPGARG